jgi:lauroyl/myristoyl acyltransferase
MERLLKIAEDFILQAPEQWAMFYPLWPESQAEIQ